MPPSGTDAARRRCHPSSRDGPRPATPDFGVHSRARAEREDARGRRRALVRAARRQGRPVRAGLPVHPRRPRGEHQAPHGGREEVLDGGQRGAAAVGAGHAGVADGARERVCHHRGGRVRRAGAARGGRGQCAVRAQRRGRGALRRGRGAERQRAGGRRGSADGGGRPRVRLPVARHVRRAAAATTTLARPHAASASPPALTRRPRPAPRADRLCAPSNPS